MDELDRRIIDRLQEGFPLCERPYAEVARGLGIEESTLIERLEARLADGTLSRFGPMFQVERMGGQFLLAALRVPEEDFERVAGLVNALPEVAHNYRREHALNMWFVLAGETPEALAAATARIERDTGLAVYAFPKLREYFVGLRLSA